MKYLIILLSLVLLGCGTDKDLKPVARDFESLFRLSCHNQINKWRIEEKVRGEWEVKRWNGGGGVGYSYTEFSSYYDAERKLEKYKQKWLHAEEMKIIRWERRQNEERLRLQRESGSFKPVTEPEKK